MRYSASIKGEYAEKMDEINEQYAFELKYITILKRGIDLVYEETVEGSED